MSNRRRKRTEAEFYVYEPGVVVPRDVTHLLVPPGVEVLQDEVFRDLGHLKEVRLSEGLREIGRWALGNCTSLERVHFPSTLVKIGEWALCGCTSLVTLHFPDGLVEIGERAFFACSSVKRISFPSTLTRIGAYAFLTCSSLEVMILVDGIRAVGDSAFMGCALENVVLPATLSLIGRDAFGSCQLLRMVKLSGGIKLIEGHVFRESELLNHVGVNPKSLVVTGNERDYNFSFATDGTIIPHTSSDRVVISSECFHSMSTAEASAFEVAIAEILRMRFAWARGDWDDIHERLRRLLAPHERRRKEEVTSILELGLWKAEMRRSGGTAAGTRAACRVTCKAGGIIPNVVPFL